MLLNATLVGGTLGAIFDYKIALKNSKKCVNIDIQITYIL